MSCVQSVLFNKDKYTPQEAKEWLKQHKFKHSKVDKRGKNLRFRQADPDIYTKFRTKKSDDGISFVIGYKEGGNLDLGSLLAKVPFTTTGIPGEMHFFIPFTGIKANYMGPGTNLKYREDHPPLDKPINNVDAICKVHDYDYKNAEENKGNVNSNELELKHEADRKMLNSLEKVNPSGIVERIMKWVAQKLISIKLKLGLGLEDYLTVDDTKIGDGINWDSLAKKYGDL